MGKRGGGARAVSAANVASKMAKVGRELTSVNQQQQKIQLERDIQYILGELRSRPEVVETVMNVLKIEDGTSVHDKKHYLSPGVEGRTLERLPAHYLRELIPQLGLQMSILKRHWGDHQSLLQILFRTTLTSGADNIFSVKKTDLTQYFVQRATDFKQHDAVQSAACQRPPEWDGNGVYEMHPPFADTCDPKDHIFKTITCYGYEAPIKTFIVTAEWGIIRNFDIGKAALVHPGLSVQPLCLDLFKSVSMDALVDRRSRMLPLGAPLDCGTGSSSSNQHHFGLALPLPGHGRVACKKPDEEFPGLVSRVFAETRTEEKVDRKEEVHAEGSATHRLAVDPAGEETGDPKLAQPQKQSDETPKDDMLQSAEEANDKDEKADAQSVSADSAGSVQENPSAEPPQTAPPRKRQAAKAALGQQSPMSAKADETPGC